MKKFISGLAAGLVIGLTLFNGQPLEGASTIRLIVNGHLIDCDVPPMLINGRVMVPARFVAEPLGATVDWDETKQAVVISTKAASKSPIKSLTNNTVQPLTANTPAQKTTTQKTVTTPTNTTTTKTTSTAKAPKDPVAPTEPGTTLTDETGSTKPGLQELTSPFK